MAVITTYDPANCPEELIAGENISLYSPGDSQTLRTLIEQLCNDPAMRLGRHARGLFEALQTWAWPSVAKAHAGVYTLEKG